MANLSLSSSRLSSNDVSSLAEVFESNFHFYCTHSSPFIVEFHQDIRTLVGLGFTVTLVDGDLLSLYQPRLETFLKLKNFHEHTSNLTYLSQVIAEMMDVATSLFQLKKHPEYYNAFTSAMGRVLRMTALNAPEKNDEAKRLKALLIRKEGE